MKTEKDVKLYKPNEVYFRSKEGNNALYASAFTFIDFGDKANVFLRYCGVRAEPSVKGVYGSSAIADNRYRFAAH